MRSNLRFLTILLGLLAIAAAIVFVGTRADRRFTELETMKRAPTAPPLRAREENLRRVVSGETIYVPVYSHIYADGGAEQLLEVTLSIRNVDLDEPIVIRSVRYHDTEGLLVAEYLDRPVELGPLASTDFLVEHRDRSGGAGANFVIEWVSESTVTEPVVEAVMVSLEGSRAFAFARPGVPLFTLRVDDEDAVDAPANEP